MYDIPNRTPKYSNLYKPSRTFYAINAYLYILVSAAEKKARQDSQAPVYLVKLRESDLILESTAALMVHVHGNPNPAVEL